MKIFIYSKKYSSQKIFELLEHYRKGRFSTIALFTSLFTEAYLLHFNFSYLCGIYAFIRPFAEIEAELRRSKTVNILSLGIERKRENKQEDKTVIRLKFFKCLHKFTNSKSFKIWKFINTSAFTTNYFQLLVHIHKTVNGLWSFCHKYKSFLHEIQV